MMKNQCNDDKLGSKSQFDCMQRFFPSEFGFDVDRTDAVEPTRSMLVASKVAIRRAVEASGVPYTYVWTGYFFG